MEETVVYGVQLPLPLDFSHTSTLPLPQLIYQAVPLPGYKFLILPKDYYEVKPVE